MRREIRVERVIEGSIEAVFQAWTTAEGMRQWWGLDKLAVYVAEANQITQGEHHASC